MSKKTFSGGRNANMLTANIGEFKGVQVPLGQIRLQTFHGTTLDGTVVNSPSVGLLGDDQIVFERGDGTVTQIGKADFEIAAVGWLSKLGYSVTAPNAGH